jgi:hypothetical protein
MAQSNLLENAQRIPVFYPYGKLANDQAPRFIRAPFVVLRMLGVEYVMPEAIGNNLPEMNILATDTVALEQMMSRADFGLEGSEEYTIGEHQLGDFNNPSLFGCHRFGII